MAMECVCDRCGFAAPALRNGLTYRAPSGWLQLMLKDELKLFCRGECAEKYRTMEKAWSDAFGDRRR